MKSNRDFFNDILLHDDLVAAPLAGISHLPFRRIMRRFFKGLVYSEMMSVEGIMRLNADSVEYLDRVADESPLVFQLFGGKPDSFSEAVKRAQEKVKVDAFDINMGCPVKKVLKAGGGCAFLSDLERMKHVVRAVRGATDLPFSVKTRIGLDQNKLIYKEILNIVQGEGADALVMHARTKSDMFGGTVRLDVLAELAAIAEIPIIGNGGVTSCDTYKAMKDTGVSGVMVGRGMMKAPWIFAALRENKDSDNYLSPHERGVLLEDMWGYMLEHANARENKRNHYIHVLRKFSVWFCKGMDSAVEFRLRVYQAPDEEGVLREIQEFFI